MEVAVGGTVVAVDRMEVAVKGIAVAVGGMGVAVEGIAVAVGGATVAVGTGLAFPQPMSKRNRINTKEICLKCKDISLFPPSLSSITCKNPLSSINNKLLRRISHLGNLYLAIWMRSR